MLNLETKLQLLQTDPSFAVYLLTGPQPEDQFLSQQLGRDYVRYMDMRRDPHVRSVLQKRRQAILGRNMLIESKSKKRGDLAAIDTAQAILDKISYERLCSSLLNTGQLIGFSVLSVDYERVDDLIIPKTTFIPQNRFVFAYYHPEDTNVPCAGGEPLDPESEIVMVGGFELRLLTRANPIVGERCPKGRFIVYTFDGDNNSPWGLGLGYSIYPWWTIKREATMAMVMQSDRLGSPPVIGTHPADIDPRDPEKAALLKSFEDFLKSISPNGWAKLPENFTAKVVEGIASASPEQQATLIGLADAQISKAVLGEISFSDKPVGGYAANESQIQDRESSITDGDCNVLDEQINESLWITIAELNYPSAKAPIVRRETTADQRKAELEQQQEAKKVQIAERDSILIQQAGFRPSDKYVQDTYGPEWSVAQLPTPVGGDPGATEPDGKVPPTAPINLGESMDYGVLIHHVLPWNGLDIGVEFHPGEVRFPGRKWSQRLRSGYGHIRNHRDETDEAPDCYIYHGLLDKENPHGSDRIWEVRQLNPKTGEHDEPKHMIGYWSGEEAQTAYLREMPPEFFGGIREITPSHMERYRMDKDPASFSYAEPDPEELDEVYAAYHQAVNMSASELEKWAETDAAKAASLDSSPIKRNLELLRTPKNKWTQKHLTWANRTIGFVSRMRGVSKGKPVSEDVPYSKRDISLKNWAYDPNKTSDHAEAIVLDGDDEILDEQDWAKLSKVGKPVIKDALETIAPTLPKEGENSHAD